MVRFFINKDRQIVLFIGPAPWGNLYVARRNNRALWSGRDKRTWWYVRVHRFHRCSAAVQSNPKQRKECHLSLGLSLIIRGPPLPFWLPTCHNKGAFNSVPKHHNQSLHFKLLVVPNLHHTYNEAKLLFFFDERGKVACTSVIHDAPWTRTFFINLGVFWGCSLSCHTNVACIACLTTEYPNYPGPKAY